MNLSVSVIIPLTSRPFSKNGGRYCFGFRRRIRRLRRPRRLHRLRGCLPYISVAIKASFFEIWHVQYMQKQILLKCF